MQIMDECINDILKLGDTLIAEEEMIKNWDKYHSHIVDDYIPIIDIIKMTEIASQNLGLKQNKYIQET